MRYLFLITLTVIATSSCATTETPRLVVDVSDQSLTIHRTGIRPEVIAISTARRGTGGKPGSNRTPLGELHVGVKKIGRFGKCMEIHGVSEDGYEQRGRYIEFHESRREPGKPGSMGCVTMRDISRLYRTTQIGDPVTIKP